MKKILTIIMSLLMILGVSVNVFAAELPNYDYRVKEITEDEAIELAKWFIANDIYENNNDGWSESTVIESVDSDNKDNYVIRLNSDLKNNGYIVVGKNISDSLIKEFAYEGEPLFADLIPLPVQESEKNSRDLNSYKKIDQTEENLPYLLVIRNNLKIRTENRDYGGITNPYSHVNSTYGSGWSYHSEYYFRFYSFRYE